MDDERGEGDLGDSIESPDRSGIAAVGPAVVAVTWPIAWGSRCIALLDRKQYKKV